MHALRDTSCGSDNREKRMTYCCTSVMCEYRLSNWGVKCQSRNSFFLLYYNNYMWSYQAVAVIFESFKINEFERPEGTVSFETRTNSAVTVKHITIDICLNLESNI